MAKGKLVRKKAGAKVIGKGQLRRKPIKIKLRKNKRKSRGSKYA
jgi:hypothetical protein